MLLRTAFSAALALVASLTAIAPASAEELRQHSMTLPDGRIVVVVEYNTSGFFRHQTRLQMIYVCDQGPTNCQAGETFQTADGGAASVIIPSAAIVGAAAAHRPNQTQTSVNSSTFSSAYQSQESNNQVVNDSFSFGDINNGTNETTYDDGGKG